MSKVNNRKKRIFVGIPIPNEIRTQLKQQLDPIKLPGKKVPSENWHFTLQFLGELEEPELQKLHAILSSLTLIKPFNVSLEFLSAFPHEKAAKILWMGVKEGLEEFTLLANLISKILAKEGFAIDERPYVPHITLSRFFPPRKMSELIKTLSIKKLSFQIDSMVLYESILKEGGTQYIEIYRYSLNTR